jgi:hypothetical protein
LNSSTLVPEKQNTKSNKRKPKQKKQNKTNKEIKNDMLWGASHER